MRSGAERPDAQSAHRALQERPKHSVMPLAGLAHAKVDQVSWSIPSRIPKAGTPFPVAASPTGHKGPTTDPNLRSPAPLATPAYSGPGCLLSSRAPPGAQRQRARPPLCKHAQTQPRYPRTYSPAPVTREVQRSVTREVQRKTTSTARARRCAANNAAPVGQSEVTVPSRRDSDWRDRFACPSPAPPVAPHSSSSASKLESPAPPAHGDGGCQHAPALTESAKALTESAGALIVSVPLPMQHEDRGHQAAASLPPVPGACLVLGDCSPLCGCSRVGSSNAPASHPASLVAPCPPDPGSPARSTLSLSSSSSARTYRHCGGPL